MDFRLWLEFESKPLWLYHVTPFADEIMRTGFIPRTKHKLGAILGGAGDEAVSFTDNLDLAEGYRAGLEVFLWAAKGEYDIDDKETMMEIARKFGLNPKDAESSWNYANRNIPVVSVSPEWDEETKKKVEKHNQEVLGKTKLDRMYNFLLQVATYPRKGRLRMPVVMGGFPERLKEAKEISILKISTAPGHGKPGPQKLTYKSGEHEYRVEDVENFDYTTLNKIR